MANKVLIVDDDPVTCELISDVLTLAEMETTSHTSSKEAADQIGVKKFDAAFLDVRMPSPDGIELARQIRSSSLNKKTVIVMITGETEQQFLNRAFEVGANFVLFKPVDKRALLRLLRVVEAPMERERQRFARVHVNCQVTMEADDKRTEGTTLDLSVNGMMVKSSHVFPVDTRLQINLKLDRSESEIRGAARVVRLVGDDCMGLFLETVSATERAKLQDFLLPLIPPE
jgi:CheY-like chemotaxis protein